MKKFLSILMTVMLVTASFTSVLAGATPPTPGGNLLTNNGEGKGATAFINNILASIQFVGYSIAIGMLIYVGIKYVMASANEKADLKNAMIKYVIGAVLIAGAATIAKWIFAIKPA